MDDDPRQQLIDRVLGDGWFPGERRELLAELDRADPLRALLAGEDRAVDAVARVIHANLPGHAGYYSHTARAVLAALREVAGIGG